MPKDALGNKTCCGRFTWDAARKCWQHPSGQEIKAKGEDFYCYKCGKRLKANGKIKKMKESDEPEE